MEEEIRRNEQKEIAAERLANASFVMGIISIVSVLCCCPFVFSAIGIILALVSKGAEKMLRPRAKTGLILSIVGMGVSFILTVFTIGLPIFMIKTNPQYKEMIIETYEESLKQSEDMIRQLYGDDVYEQMLEMMDEL